jgi:hypothetical protein
VSGIPRPPPDYESQFIPEKKVPDLDAFDILGMGCDILFHAFGDWMKDEIYRFEHNEMTYDESLANLKALRRDKSMRPMLLTISEFKKLRGKER